MAQTQIPEPILSKEDGSIMIGRDHSRLSRSSLPPAWGGSGHFLDSAKEERGIVATTTDFTVCPSGSLHIALQFAHCPRHPDRGVNGGCSAPKLCTLGPAPRQGCIPSSCQLLQSLPQLSRGVHVPFHMAQSQSLSKIAVQGPSHSYSKCSNWHSLSWSSGSG